MQGGHLYYCYEEHIERDGRTSFSNRRYGGDLLPYLCYWHHVPFARREPAVGRYYIRRHHVGVGDPWCPFCMEGELVA